MRANSVFIVLFGIKKDLRFEENTLLKLDIHKEEPMKTEVGHAMAK